MHDARLMHSFREGRVDGLAEAGEAIGADEQDVVNAAIFQLCQDAEPELGAFARGHPEPQHVACAVDAHAECDVERALLYLAAVAHADEQRVEIDDRIHGLERPRLPGSELVHHAFGRARNQVGRDLRAVQLTQVMLDVTLGHAARVQRDDLFVEALEPALVFLD